MFFSIFLFFLFALYIACPSSRLKCKLVDFLYRLSTRYGFERIGGFTPFLSTRSANSELISSQ